jgi:hypothetical protein
MKRFYLILSIVFFAQFLFLLAYFAVGVISASETAQNIKFYSAVASLLLGILFLTLYNRKNKQDANTHGNRQIRL